MTFRLLDMVRVAPSSAPGTGNFTGLSAVAGFQLPAAAGAAVGDTFPYGIIDGSSAREEGVATVVSGPAISRSVITYSTNGGAAISASANAQLYGTARAADIVTPALIQSYLAGLQLANDATTPNTVLDVSAGVAIDSGNAYLIRLAAFTKSSAGAWTAGSGNDGMGSGLTAAANTWYHVFAILNAGAADIYFDTSITAANAPAGTTAFRYIGDIKTDGSGHILPFTQNGDELLWKTPVNALSAAAASTTASLVTVATPPGVETWALVTLEAAYVSGGGATILIYPPDMGTQTANSPAGFGSLTVTSTATSAAVTLRVRTNASGQIGLVSTTTGAEVWLNTYGYINRRGRDT